ncbi:bifunctional (p)ppGpp synthetase/guanosine-3',5'-bis(diphosphate) 3'-pyrophosphohydrolase [Candidatus Microgenomates bacterium]|nr:bifunctional (p)ppGpp synthetase/guanosine-3',5'-bis(diphosphate) 3'-pyrophosphohydrolase [Candidatus Microgenomates bacterium]
MKSKVALNQPMDDQQAALLRKLERWANLLSEKPQHQDSANNLIDLMISSAGNSPVIAMLPNRFTSRLKAASANQQQTLARKGLLLFAPLADRLGMAGLKNQIEDQCFKILRPQRFTLVEKLIQQALSQTAASIKHLKQQLLQTLKDHQVKVVAISGRRKHAYSIYRKLAKAGNIENIYDLVGLRVVVATTAGCYQALDVIQKQWQPVAGRFKDYIASPKANGYQSLHTTVRLPDGNAIEIQIRTPRMHELAEYGLAAHWHYAQQKTSKQYRARRVPPAIKFKSSPRRVYVFSPKGDVYGLPQGATVLDFAFEVHSAVGLRAKAAKVNRRIARLNQALQNGDLVEIITQKRPQPHRDWLNYACSPKARNRIKAWLKTVERDQYVALGERLLKEALIAAKQKPSLDLEQAASLAKYQQVEDLLLAVGSGVISAQHVLELLAPKPTRPRDISRQPQGQPAVMIAGMRGLAYHLAVCCQPQAPDPIIGHITQSAGIAVHRKICHNVVSDSKRLVACAWQ